MNDVFALLDGVGGPEVLVIGVLALLMFGSKRLPELGRSLGRAIREFKRATREVEDNIREAMREEPTPRIRPPAKQVRSRTNTNPPPSEDPKEVSETPVKPAQTVQPQDFPKQEGETF